MANQNPDLFLIQMGDSADPVVFGTLCGLRSRSFTLGGDAIDVTTIDCAGSTNNAWQESAHGLRTVELSGSGFFKDKAQTVSLVNKKMTGNGIEDFNVIVPGLGAFTGKFLIGSLGIAAEIGGGGVSQEISLSSSGPIVFVAES
jgi:predicted secreted protein